MEKERKWNVVSDLLFSCYVSCTAGVNREGIGKNVYGILIFQICSLDLLRVYFNLICECIQ